MSFPYWSIYLNFNRIDMKKEMCKQKAISMRQSKHVQETRHSAKKQGCQQRTRKLKLSHKIIKKTSKLSSQSSCAKFKANADSQQFETSIDTPQEVNLEHYLQDIDTHMIELDQVFHNSLHGKTEHAYTTTINPEMRKILVKWLIKVAARFRAKSETLHMCVQIIDLMLIHQDAFFNRSNFQLLGIAALFVSCKYHEIYTVQAQKYVELCDGIYSASQLFEMEGLILLELGFSLQIPTLPQFADRFIQNCSVSPQAEDLIRNLIKMTLLDFNTFNNLCKFQLCSAIAYLTAKVYNLEPLKNQLISSKNKISPEKFNQSLIAAMSLFKKFQSHCMIPQTNNPNSSSYSNTSSSF